MATLFLGREGAPLEPASRQRTADKPADYFFAERVLTLLLIAIVALWLRARDPGFITAYMDESIYVVYGRMFLAHHFEAPIASPLRWSFGWYLWPMLSALADRAGGLIAVRELAALLGTASVIAVYGFARRLYGSAVGLASAALFAVLTPAVMASRIATRDAGSIFFFTVGLWAFAGAWQSNRKRGWLAAVFWLLGAFLCKYFIAIYLPFLALLALRKGWRAALTFTLPLTAALTAYLVYYWPDLHYLLVYGGSYNSLRASGAQLRQIYLTGRIDLWLIGALALLALLVRDRRPTTILLCLGAALALGFQWKTRADFDFWKHAVYPLIFFVPPAVHALLTAAQRFVERPGRRAELSIASVLLLIAVCAWSGKSFAYDRAVFWPNVEPVLSYFEGRLPGNARLLTDDSVFRYYLNPQLSQSQIVDPFYFHYGQERGPAAYAQAVEDGWFDFIVLDGGSSPEAHVLQHAIAGHLQRYTLRLQMPDPVLGQSIQIYQRSDAATVAAAPNAPAIEISTPAANSLVDRVTTIRGTVRGAAAGWYVRPEVFSDRWYASPPVNLAADGGFVASVIFGGEGEQACHQMLRVRLYDALGQPRAVSVLFNLKTSGSNCR